MMQGLFVLYDHMGRRAEWARLVAEVKDDFVELATDGPLPGREEEWYLVNQYRVQLARGARQWAEAERLQQAAVRRAREHAAAALALSAEAPDAAQRHRIRGLGAALHELGEVQRERGQANCIASYTEAAEMAKRAGYRAGEAIVAFKLGHAYRDLGDLAEAERWYRRSLEMYEDEQRHLRAQCFNELGAVAYKRFEEALAAKRPEKELFEHLNAALRFNHQGLDLLPPDAVSDLAITHNALGVFYSSADDLDRALPHFQDAIRYHEKEDDLCSAARTRFNVALALFHASRLADARSYALAALRNLETYGDRAADENQQTRDLLAAIDHRLHPSQPT
jgi:tetratricopeptide (TPR) repeat protein